MFLLFYVNNVRLRGIYEVVGKGVSEGEKDVRVGSSKYVLLYFW